MEILKDVGNEKNIFNFYKTVFKTYQSSVVSIN